MRRKRKNQGRGGGMTRGAKGVVRNEGADRRWVVKKRNCEENGKRDGRKRKPFGRNEGWFVITYIFDSIFSPFFFAEGTESVASVISCQ